MDLFGKDFYGGIFFVYGEVFWEGFYREFDFYGKDFCWVVDFNGFLWGGFPGQDFYGEDFLRLREDFLREVDFYGFFTGTILWGGFFYVYEEDFIIGGGFLWVCGFLQFFTGSLFKGR